MAQTGAIGTIDAESAYIQSFGMLKAGTRYFDPVNNVDMRQTGQVLGNAYEAGLKAMSTSGMSAGTAGKSIIPVYLDPKIVDTTRKFLPLVEIIPRVANQGLTADYVTLSKGMAYSAAEDAALPETNDTYTRVSKTIKYLYSVGRVTGQSIAAVPSFMLAGFVGSQGTPEGTFGDASAPNAMQLEVVAKSRELKELEENMIVNGNSSTTGTGSGSPNGTEFDGIIALMSTTNTVAKGTTALTLDDINLAIRYAFDDGGRPNIAVCSSDVYRDIQNLVTAKFGYMQAEKSIYWGYTTITLRTMVGELPLIPSMYLSNTTGSKAIYFLDLSVVEVRVLQDMTYEKLAKTNDSEKFMLKIYETFIIRNTSFCSSVTAISA